MDSRIYILTHKQLTGQLSQTESAEFAKLSLNPEVKALSEEISYLWNVSNNYFPTKDWKKDAAKQAMLNQIRKPVSSSRPISTATSFKFNWTRILGAAAVILLFSWLIFSLLAPKEKVQAVNDIEYAEILDDTRIWLDKGASITILKESEYENKIALVGEAFFDVDHNPARIFTIDLGKGIFAEVLGTSFKASSTHGGANGRVSVREGKVRLYSTKNNDYNLILTDGEEGELNPDKEIIKRDNFERHQALFEQSGPLSFDDTPLDEVLDRLGLHYGVQFKYDRNVIKTCRYSAGVPTDATIDQTLMSILGVHEGLKITPDNSGSYKITGKCD